MKRTKLIEYRGERTQADMAKMYGVSQQAWGNWEKGNGKPNVVLMKKLELDSGIPMEEIFADVFDNNILLSAQ